MTQNIEEESSEIHIPRNDKCTDTPSCCPYDYYDIICIGAGATGLYLGYKMMRNKCSRSLLLIDKADRVGGMIYSTPINEEAPYMIEGCANRYLITQDRIREVIDFFDIESVRVPNDRVATNTDCGILDDILDSYDPQCDGLYNTEISNIDGIVNTPSIEEGDYKRLLQFTAETGYPNLSENTNLNTFIERAQEPDQPYQYFIKKGFLHLMKKMAKYVRKCYPIHLNTVINDVKYDPCCNLYILNGKYACRRLVYTGNPNDLMELNTNSHALREMKRMVNKGEGVNGTYITMYIDFEDPWWTEDQIMTLFRSKGPLTALFYYSSSTIKIYTGETQAKLLYYMIPKKYRHKGHNTIKWMDIENTPRLAQLIKKYILEMVKKGQEDTPEYKLNVPTDEQLDSMFRMAFKYTPQATFRLGPLPKKEYKSFFSSLNRGNKGISLLGDKYYDKGAWVNSCFECVDENFKAIMK